MSDILPQSRALAGVIVAIEGLAVWVVAIFLESLRATGWIIWPGADMYTTAFGTMYTWFTSGPPGPFELLAYFGLAVAIGGPVWFWLMKPTLHIMDRRSTGRQPSGRNPSSQGSRWEDGDWIPAAEIADDTAPEDEEGDSSSWVTKAFESNPSRPDSARAALAKGDFMRGSTGDMSDRDAKD